MPMTRALAKQNWAGDAYSHTQEILISRLVS